MIKRREQIFCVFACMKYKNLMIREEFSANAHPFERENTKDRTEKSYNDVELLKAFQKFWLPNIVGGILKFFLNIPTCIC